MSSIFNHLGEEYLGPGWSQWMVGEEIGFRIYFEGKAKQICCWIGHGLGEKEKNRVTLRVFVLSNWVNRIAIY